MREKVKLYLRDTDSTNCERIEDIIHDAELEGLKEVTVLEADPDDYTSEYIWCQIYDCVQKGDCGKSICSRYKSKSGRGKCEHKGRLYFHGK